MEYQMYVRRMDLLKMNFLLLPKLPHSYMMLGFLIACAAFGEIKSIEERGIFFWLFSSTIIGFVIFLVVYIFAILFQVVTASVEKGVIGKTIYKLEDEYFIEETQGTQTKTLWGSISGLYKYKKYMFIRINGYRIHLIPKREFENSMEFESFCEKVIHFKNNA